MKTTHHPEINSALRRHEEGRKNLCSLSFDMWNIEEVMDECGVKDFRTYPYAFPGEIDVVIPIKNLACITPVLRAFAERGYTQLEKMQKVNTSYGGFKWKLHHPRGTFKGQVSIRGTVPREGEGKGEACRLVQVGTETHTTPVFEVVCDKGKEETE